MQPNNNITISPYRRLSAAGFDIVVRNHGTKFKITLVRGQEQVASGFAARSHRLSNAQALEKAQLNTWGTTTEFHAVLSQLADVASSLQTV